MRLDGELRLRPIKSELAAEGSFMHRLSLRPLSNLARYLVGANSFLFCFKEYATWLQIVIRHPNLVELVEKALCKWWQTDCLWFWLENFWLMPRTVVMKGPLPQVSVVGLAEDCWPSSSLPALGRIVGPGPGTWLHLPTPLPVQHQGTVAWLYAPVKALHGSADL